MAEDKVEFTLLDSKVIGSNVVIFHLSDGTVVKAFVDIARAGVATNYRNPDGSPQYAIDAQMRIVVAPKDGKFTLPATQVAQRQPPNLMT